MPVSQSTKTITRDRSTLVVYAPFGTDPTLSAFPDGTTSELSQHPLLKNLLRVAELGADVVALIDLVEDDTFLVEIPAGKPEALHVTSRWKQDMSAPETLGGLLRHARAYRPENSLILALEGHGAGYMPDLDRTQLTHEGLTHGGTVEWRVRSDRMFTTAPGSDEPSLPPGNPILPMVVPLLPGQAPLSTFGIAQGLKFGMAQGASGPAVIHFNNCFNMSIELLHTVAPYADHAVGYCNYNFFTSGDTYPQVFKQLRDKGSATPGELAQWFALANEAALAAKGNHPTIGAVVDLSRMREISERLDDLSDALLSALRISPDRDAILGMIEQAIHDSVQYDTRVGYELETPDELTDLYSFAVALQKPDFTPFLVGPAAAALQKSMEGIFAYGADDEPWIDPGVNWNFSSGQLAMNIFLPDPLRQGIYDWRAPFYLDVNPDPSLPRVQKGIIEFLKVTDWVDFLIEYHKTTKFVGLLPAVIPIYPVFNRKYVPPKQDDPGCPDKPPCDPPPGCRDDDSQSGY